MVKVANLVFNSMLNDSRVIKESKSLGANNYKVEVIAHLDKNLEEFENRDNYILKRFSYLDRSITKSKIVKLKAYLKYLKLSVYYCKKHDILHCNDLNTLPIGFIVKKLFNKNVKIVYDAHEYETEVNGLSGIKKIFTKMLEKFLIKYADKVICVSDSIACEYVRLYDIEKPSLILNTPFYTKIKKKNLFREKLKIKDNQNIFLYQGSLTFGRGIEILIKTFKNLDDKSIIVFMGYGPLEELLKKEANNYSNIYFHPAVSPDILLNYTSSADYGISTIEDSCLSYRYCLPNKMFEYIMAEIPLIVSNLPEMKRIVQKYKVGTVSFSNESKDLLKAITEIIKIDKKELVNNLQKVKIVYNWEEQEKNLLTLYKELENV